ncbi:MAG: SDR family oxidoreductase [Actinobacteria bacterium]|nr:SDR family oxidoreductase [Actinomycetota bacterium]
MVTQPRAARPWVVTGAASGMGHELARTLTAEGVRVHAWDRDPVPAAAGGGVAVDLADPEQIVAAAARVEGPLACLAHCAGVLLPTSIDDHTAATHLRTSLEVHCTSLLLATQALRDRLRNGGSIVAVTSVATTVGYRGSLAYGPSRAALARLVQQLAVDLAPDGIRVNAVSPGAVRTPMTAHLWSDAEADARRQHSVPIPRRADPGEVTTVIRFLASNAASYITGTEVRVDGGFVAALSRPGGHTVTS